MELKIETDEGKYTIHITGDINLYNAAVLKEAFRSGEDEESENFIVDLAGVRYIDSSGLGALIYGAGLAKKSGADFICINASQDIDYIFRSVNLDKMLGAPSV